MKGQGLGIRAQGLGVVLLGLGLASGASAQGISFGGDAGAAKKQHVTFLSDGIVVKSGKEQVVELRFRVDEGFHINSHTPKDELLIPTLLKLDSGHGVEVRGEEYPKGTTFKLNIGDGEMLDVYQGEFRVRVRMVAGVGASNLTGTLHYQACDEAVCYPARSLPVQVSITAK